MLVHKFISTFYVNAQTFYEAFDNRTKCVENLGRCNSVTAKYCCVDIQV